MTISPAERPDDVAADLRASDHAAVASHLDVEDPTVFDGPDPWAEPPGMGRSMVHGALLAGLIMFVAVGALALAIGQSPGAAFAMAAFISFWGGIGFGGMLGAEIGATRADRDHHLHPH